MDETMLLIAGTIGAGKSSLTDMLSQEMNSKPFYENVDDNEVLPLFYSNPEKYTFLLQVFFLNKRFLAMKDALPQADNVLDRSIYEDSLLFHLNADLGRVSSEEVKQYDHLLDTMLKELEHTAPKKDPICWYTSKSHLMSCWRGLKNVAEIMNKSLRIQSYMIITSWLMNVMKNGLTASRFVPKFKLTETAMILLLIQRQQKS